MLIKQMDDRAGELAALERLAAIGSGEVAQKARKERDLRKAGIRGERESAYLIDFHYSASRNWAVIHDLRLEHGGRTAQIDHLLLNRALECYVLESKHFHAGIKITDDGEFLRWNRYRKTYEGMASPLAQNERHVIVLQDVFKSMELPTRLGLRLMPSFRPYVLVSPDSRIDRPSKFDTSRVIKADKIRQQVLDNIDTERVLSSLKGMARLVSGDTLRDVAERLASMHRPVRWPVPRVAEPMASPVGAGSGKAEVKRGTATVTAVLAHPAKPTPPIAAVIAEAAKAGPKCKTCRKRDGSILHGKYGYYFKCSACDENTKISFTCQPGHKPRLRKARDRFYRDCADCGTSELYFTNA